MAHNFITVQNAKDWLSLTTSTDDGRLGTMVDAACSRIAKYCGTRFDAPQAIGPTASPPSIELLDGTNTDLIIVEHTPIISVQALYLGVDPQGANGTLVDPQGYDVDNDGAYIVLRFYDTQRMRNTLRVDYTYGYQTPPDDVVMAALLTVEAWYRRLNRRSIDLGSKAKDGETESYQAAWDPRSGLPKAALGLLADYVQLEIPTAMAPRGR